MDVILTERKSQERGMKKKFVNLSGCIFLFIILTSTSCKKHDIQHHTKEADLKIHDIDIVEQKMFKGLLIGTEFERNEIYIRLSGGGDLLQRGDPFYRIGVIDTETVEIKKVLNVEGGESQSPTGCTNPVYIDYIDNRFYLVDWFYKTMVRDHEFNHLYTNMFKGIAIRYFIDFYKYNGKAFYVAGIRHTGFENNTCSVELQEIGKIGGFKSHKEVYEINHKGLGYTANTKTPLHGELWSSSWGFEKDERVFFCNGAENKYYIYDLNQNNLESIQLNYLIGHKSVDTDSERIINEIYQTREMYEGIEKRYNKKYKFIAHPEKIFIFGFYDVGKNKLGIAGDIDLDKMAFRLDILKSDSGEYLESIWLPIGHGFLRQFAESTRGLFITRINVDKGIYVYMDYPIGEDMEFYMKFFQFEILKE